MRTLLISVTLVPTKYSIEPKSVWLVHHSIYSIHTCSRAYFMEILKYKMYILIHDFQLWKMECLLCVDLSRMRNDLSCMLLSSSFQQRYVNRKFPVEYVLTPTAESINRWKWTMSKYFTVSLLHMFIYQSTRKLTHPKCHHMSTSLPSSQHWSLKFKNENEMWKIKWKSAYK